MKANRAYRVIHAGSGAVPAFLSDPDRVEHVEVVSIDSGEVELFWDCTPAAARRLTRRLKTDLAQLEADEFIGVWRDRTDVEVI
jgi:hypothetical protein